MEMVARRGTLGTHHCSCYETGEAGAVGAVGEVVEGKRL